MDQNVQVMAKRVWHIVRVAFFMLGKNICKKKLLLDFKYFTMKRPKLAGKLTVHHHDGDAYEFKKAKRGRKHAPIYKEEESEMHAVERVLELMISNDDVGSSPYPYLYSPALPGFGFGRSPAVRQLRLTDSPYPVLNDDEGRETGRVDEAAEEFIQRFYAQLRQQRITDA